MPLVSVVCTTFNQKNYVEDSIRGFLIQKTKFPFEVIIHDDASTDGTSEIIQKYNYLYPKIIIPIIQKENQYSKGASILKIAASSASGEYLAICEGDDFWVNPFKLENQINLFNRDRDCGLVYSQAFVLREKNKSIDRNLVGQKFLSNEILYKNPIPTLTTIFKKNLFDKYLLEMESKLIDWKMADYPIWLWFYCNSKIIFLPKSSAVYRVLGGTASRPNDDEKRYSFQLNSFEIAEFFAKKICTSIEYDLFLEKRHLILYLYCLKNKMKHSDLHLLNLKKLKSSKIKTKIVIFILDDLRLGSIIPLLHKITHLSRFARYILN